MKFRLLIRIGMILAILLTSLGSTTLGVGASQANSRFETLIEKARAEGDLEVIVEVAAIDLQDAALDAIDGLDADLRVRYEVFPLLALTASSAALEALAASSAVVNISENVARSPALDATLPVINGDDVQTLGWTGAGQTIAILDTGIDNNHPFFGSRIVDEACFSNAAGAGTGMTLCPDGTNNQTGVGSANVVGVANCTNAGANICDHGTHVAGIAAGAANGTTGEPGNGVAPGANIIVIQVFTRFTTGCTAPATVCVRTYDSDQILGMQRVVQLSANMNIAAVNMSLGAGTNMTACDTDPREPAVAALGIAGIATVIAAGNDSLLNAVGAPACISNAVTVGSTNDDDGVSSFSNRGPLLDLFAPGCRVDSVGAEFGMTSAVPDDTFGFKCGTSMAAPHVAGAFAILRQAYPTATIGQMLGWMQTTGVPINYDTNGDTTNDQTTPRLNLLAALQANNAPPTLAATQATVTVNEGQTAANTGTFSDPENNPVTLSASIGTLTPTGGGNWSWSFGTNDGPAQGQTVTITGTDDKGESGSVSFALVVNNVKPSVTIDPGQITVINEGGTVQVQATYSDPGWVDTHTAQVNWGTGEPLQAVTPVVTSASAPAATGTVTASHQYGDNGSFTITVSVTDKDGETGSASFVLTVGNLDPTAAIDLSGATIVNGVPTILSQSGSSVPFTGTSTDPGSDDLTLSWDFADGTPVVSTTYLVNPPNPDPSPSPSVQARDVTDSVAHTFGSACFYEIGFWSADDDLGVSAVANANVIIVGNAVRARSQGYWQTTYRALGTGEFSDATLQCYLAITRHMSQVFSEDRALANIQDADAVFNVSQKPTMAELLDQQLLAAWLNFANGSIGYDELVVTTNKKVADTPFYVALATAEAIRLDPNATKAQLEQQKDILERINLRNGG